MSRRRQPSPNKEVAAALLNKQLVEADLHRFIEEDFSVYPPSLHTAYDTLKNDITTNRREVLTASSPDDAAHIISEFATLLAKLSAAYRSKCSLLTTTPTTVANVNPVPDIALPPISIASFHGNHRDWPAFAAEFTAAMKQKPYSDRQKIQYLSASLKGQAKESFGYSAAAATDFTSLWATLDAKYNDPSRIAVEHIHRVTALPPATTAKQYHQLVDVVRQTDMGLSLLHLPSDPRSEAILSAIVMDRMDSEALMNWHTSSLRPAKTLAPLENLLTFLTSWANSRQTPSTPTPATQSSQPNQAHPKRAVSATSHSCFQCSATHLLKDCPAFLAATLPQRNATIKKANLCRNCFSTKHVATSCTSKFSCRTCAGRHHTLLHAPTPEVSAASVGPAPGVLLATAVVLINNQPVRAFFDTGSQVSLISAHAVHRLGLSTQPSAPGSTLTLAGASTKPISTTTSCTISSRTSQFAMSIEPLVMPQVTSPLPTSPVDIRPLHHLTEGHHLADPGFHTPGPIDLLLGADVCARSLQQKLHEYQGISTHNTTFGVILMGRISSSPRTHVAATALASLQQFWELEELPSTKILTPEEDLAISRTQITTLPDGRLQTNLPLREDPVLLGDSRHMAIKRFKSLEAKFARQPAFAQEYRKVFEDYIARGHAELAPVPPADPARTYYLPHHAVMRPTASTTKLRIVFDGSAKTTNGRSLNDIQLAGPKQQDDLFHILVRFRTHAVALTCDIQQMYRQVAVTPSDRDLQRIIYRPAPSVPLQEYRLTTVTFGQKAAPFLAIRALQTAASRATSPMVQSAIKSDFYVDDLLTGAPSATAATALREAITSTLLLAGFPTHKWTSNHPAVVPASQGDVCLTTPTDQHGTLGLIWSTHADTFTIRVKPPPNKTWTRRSVLSVASSLFDPLGWLAPTTIVAKLLMQAIVATKADWDSPLPANILNQWQAWLLQLDTLRHVQITRAIDASASSVALIVFCDASETAYAATAYLRAIQPDGTYRTTLVAAKTKVAPLQRQTLPRLELLGALLAARLVQEILIAIRKPMPIFAYTDSTIALAWIQSHPSRWQTFVANRTSTIQAIIPPTQWQHVKSSDNPADVASRGIPPGELEHFRLWWHGPPWLQTTTASMSQPATVKAPEAKTTLITAAVLGPPPDILHLLTKFSTFTKLRGVLARVLFLLDRLRKKAAVLQTSHFTRADETIYQWIQPSEFSDEIGALRLQQSIPSTSPLSRLNPKIDDNGILRLGGRLTHATLPFHTKHPIVLPKNHHVTTLIIRQFHEDNLHAGPTHVHHLLRQRYWFPHMVSKIKHQLRQCLRCTRLKATTAQQMMADLPPSRVTPVSRPFQRCGVDFAGPVLLKTKLARSSRSYKGYISLFICFTTRAIHLELVTDLSTPAFLAAFTRFTSRRGLPSDVYSDNGTNFVGANNIFLEQAAQSLAASHITWHFIPPSAPHFGGLWEAGVKSTKSHLAKTIGNTLLTYEEYATVLCRVEAVLNSRPLTPLTSDPADCDALTPAHFLIQGTLQAPPEADLTNENRHTLKRWALIQQLSQHMWRRWSTEYLTRLQNRPKWWRPRPNLEPGRLVLIADPNLPPLDWRLGRITAIHPGPDNLARVATVQTTRGTLQRPIHKLCPLPLDTTAPSPQ